MSDVQRYSFDVDYGMVESASYGQWVRYEDVAALQRKVAELKEAMTLSARQAVAHTEGLRAAKEAAEEECRVREANSNEWQARCLEAEQRCAELAKDAARYRWLRNETMKSAYVGIACVNYRCIGSDWTTATEIDELDSFIDAASPQGSSPAGAGKDNA